MDSCTIKSLYMSSKLPENDYIENPINILKSGVFLMPYKFYAVTQITKSI